MLIYPAAINGKCFTISNDISSNNPVVPRFGTNRSFLGVFVLDPKVGGVLVSTVFKNKSFYGDVPQTPLNRSKETSSGGNLNLEITGIKLVKMNVDSVLIFTVPP